MKEKMVQKLKTSIFQGLLLSALLVSPAWSSGDARRNHMVAYEVYAGGLHAMSIDMDMFMNPTDYRVQMKARPHGMIGKLLPWRGMYQVNGQIKDNTLQPKQQIQTSSWNLETDKTILNYNEKGQLIKAKRVELKDGETIRAYEHAFTPEMAANTVDLMTSVTVMFKKADEKETCNTSVPVFDGKRRFNMVFKQIGTSNLTANRFNAYQGTAIKCTVEIDPVAGWQEKKRGYFRIQETSRANGSLPTIWLGRAYANGPMIPVRMEIKSEYGAILMHFKSIKLKDQTTALVD